ncbi:MAG TPA: hypothetical protein VJ867_03950 [Gemmatimonadaceae bacterium]|nr:hypothetical protein [Gemmatimonadaceae bacterium]
MTGPVLRRACWCAAAALVAACGTDPVSPPETDFPISVEIVNNLFAPVSIAVDGRPQVALPSGASTSLTVSSHSQWITWSSAKPMDENGVPIPDDIGDIAVAVGGIRRTLDITNVIQDLPYITARIYNDTPAAVSIGVFDGASVTCVSKLPGSTVTTRKFTQTGYYRFQSGTELRAYRDPANCTGPYVAWSHPTLQDFIPRSGLLLLTLSVAP